MTKSKTKPVRRIIRISGLGNEVSGSHPFEHFGFKWWVTPGQNHSIIFGHGRYFTATEETTGCAIPGLWCKKRSEVKRRAIEKLNAAGESKVKEAVNSFPKLKPAPSPQLPP